MRITHMVWGLTRGGIESMLADIARMQAEAHAIQIVVVNDEVDNELVAELDSRIKVSLLRRQRNSRNPWFFIKLMWSLGSFRPQLIHAHQLSLAALLKWFRRPKVATVHDMIFEDLGCAGDYTILFAISEAVRRVVMEKFPRLQCKTILNGIDCAGIAIRPARALNEFKILQISRLELPKKGQDVALRALAELMQHNDKIKPRLDFVGSGPALDELQALARELNVENHVYFRGNLARMDLYQSLKDYDLLIQPSRFEGFGLTIIEAMAAKVPVLVSDIDGPREIVAQGRYGYLFRSEDPNDLANGILEIHAQYSTPQFVQKLELAREKAVADYDIRTTAQNYLNAYAQILASGKVALTQ